MVPLWLHVRCLNLNPGLKRFIKMLSLTYRHIRKASNPLVLEPHWGYVSQILSCTNDVGSREYLDAVYCMHDISMLYTFIFGLSLASRWSFLLYESRKQSALAGVPTKVGMADKSHEGGPAHIIGPGGQRKLFRQSGRCPRGSLVSSEMSPGRDFWFSSYY
jgi:hypothetical protein